MWLEIKSWEATYEIYVKKDGSVKEKLVYVDVFGAANIKLSKKDKGGGELKFIGLRRVG